MGDYIERDKVINMLDDAQLISDGEYCGYCTEDVSIMSIPSADVRPIVYAKWETGYYNDQGDYVWPCSECKKESKELTTYCPHCGATMMEE